MEEQIRVLLTEEELDARIRQIGAEISHDLQEKDILVVCVLKGAAFFACELAKRITVPVTMEFIRCSSYGNGTVSTGKVQIVQDVTCSVEGRHVLLVEDIIDSGNTLSFLRQEFADRGAASVQTAVLLDKPSRREVSVPVEYTGFQVPDLFVVGYGLDYAQKYRNLPYIGEITGV